MADKQKTPFSKIKILDYSILFLLAIFLFVLVIDYGFLKLNESPYYKTLKEISEPIFWLLIFLFILDLYIKYKKTRDLMIFIKKHWFDIVTLCLIPIFSGMKFAKLMVKVLKQLKILKTGTKFIHKLKKSLKTI